MRLPRLIPHVALLVLTVMMAVSLQPRVAEAATFTVNSTADAVDANPGDGQCDDGSGNCTLRAAIMEANALPGADTIILPAGTYILTIPGANEDAGATGDLDITDGLTINGAGAADTIIDASGVDRVLHVLTSATAKISGVTIQHGDARGGIPVGVGGGFSNSGVVSLTNSTVIGNTAGDTGGGIFNFNEGTVALTNSTVSGNTAGFNAGGIFNGGTLTLTNSTISGNTAGQFAGGIYNIGQDATAAVNNSTVSGNTADHTGGGIFNFETLTLSNSTVRSNTASRDGGGIFNSGGTLTLINSTVSGNIAPNGGGIFNQFTQFTPLILTNSTVSDNQADNGGGITNRGFTSTVVLNNTIVASNTALVDGPDCWVLLRSILQSQGYNLIGDATNCDFLATPSDLVGTKDNPIEPLLGPLQDNGGPTFTHALLPGSPAIDHIPAASCTDADGNPITTDQRGVARPQGSACDIGAFEAPIYVTNTDDTNSTCTPTNCALREAIAVANSGDTIMIPAGTYTLTLGFQLTINKDLTLEGEKAETTIIQANEEPGVADFRVLAIMGGNVAMSGLTVRHGNKAGSGGGIYNKGNLILTLSIVSGNAARDGGAILNEGTLTLTNSTISKNTGGGGGGIRNFGGTLTGTSNRITNNRANLGGGLLNNGTLTLTNSTISGNTGDIGGGIFNDTGSTLTLTNVTISGNKPGGGIYNSGTLTLTNSTVSNNTAGNGGGTYNDDGTMDLYNTGIAGNMAPTRTDCSGTHISLGHNLIGDSTGCEFLLASGDLLGTAAIPVDPLLGPLQDNGGPTMTHALLPGSPAIDSGSPDCPPPAADQRGMARPQGSGCDIGAFELGPISTLGDQNNDGVVNIFDAIISLQIIAKVVEPTFEQRILGDVVPDGEVNILDVVLTLQYVMGLIPLPG